MLRMRWVIVVLVGVGIVIRVVPLLSNAFYFTVDQGRDTVFVREIAEQHKLVWQGPETTIRGIFTLPGWYYFLALGYLTTQGHPVGGVLMMIGLNMLVMTIVVWWVAKRWGGWTAIAVGATMTVSWPWYDTSRWAFNPFPLVSLAIAMLLILYERKWWLGAGIVFLAANVHLAGAAVLAGWWLPPLALIGMIKAGGQQFWLVGQELWRVFTVATVPQSTAISLGLWMWVGFVGRKDRLVKLVMLLVLVTWGVVGAAQVYRDWYVVFLPVVLQIVLVIRLVKFRFGWLVLAGVVVAQGLVFGQRYGQYLHPGNDPGVLANQMKVVDWIYETAGGQGFEAYVYTNTFYDYSYQYVWWWYGQEKYGYVPCHYSNFPGSNKAEYVPGWEHYTLGARCDKWRYLIIESATNGDINADWIEDYKATTQLLDLIMIGRTRVEKRVITNKYKERYNELLLWRTYRDNEMELTVPDYWKYQNYKNTLMAQNDDESIRVIMDRIGKGCYRWNAQASKQKLISGQKNDYVIEIYTMGLMERAVAVVEKVLDGARIHEDSGTKALPGCILEG